MVYLEIWNEEISIFQKFGNNGKIKCNISCNACKEIHTTARGNRMKHILDPLLIFITNWSKRGIVQLQSTKRSLSKTSSQAAARRFC